MPCFNEAAGIHRRKEGLIAWKPSESIYASMRPPEFTGGKSRAAISSASRASCFNEAAGIHRRKVLLGYINYPRAFGFNEAAGIHRRKATALGVDLQSVAERLQ